MVSITRTRNEQFSSAHVGAPSTRSYATLWHQRNRQINLRDHYCPPPSVTVQRYNFNSRTQKEGETVSQFVAELRRLSEHCDFKATLDDMLRDRIVCRVYSAGFWPSPGSRSRKPSSWCSQLNRRRKMPQRSSALLPWLSTRYRRLRRYRQVTKHMLPLRG